ncbi:MAG: EAL domain-containing protein [Clostridiales bacterium]|nr:EAL domain-containing protein [Clostridiales bacterium]
MNKGKRLNRRIVSFFISALILIPVFLPHFAVLSQSAGRIVRVGWYESPFNKTDSLGRRSGYAYEYQQKIAAYTGWTYEYVHGSWSGLMEMLEQGKIDLLSDVSYSPERSESMLFSASPMGSEEYYIFVSDGNEQILKEDFSTLNGKKIGVNKGSVMIDCFNDWAEKNGVDAQLVELNGTEEANIEKVVRKNIDAYITIDAFLDSKRVVPLCKIGSSDFFFAVNESRPEIVQELNNAMNRILEEDPNYNQKLTAEYMTTVGTNYFLSQEEKRWISEHKVIRVGYQDNYLAFCAKDPRSGELIGALKDYINYAADAFENEHLIFETVAFPTANDAMEALKNGDVDCMFPANLTDYDGEAQGMFMTPPLMRTDMYAVVQESSKTTFFKKERVTVAVNAGNPNYDMFLLDHFPEWRTIYFKDTTECLNAVADGKADCVIISNYRYSNIEKICKKLKLSTVSTGVEMDYCFAVGRENTTLYSILAKVTEIVPLPTVHSALSYYSSQDAKTVLVDMFRPYYGIVFCVFAMAVSAIVFLIRRNTKEERISKEKQRIINKTENDEITDLYDRNYFFIYSERIYRENPDRPMDAVVLNIEQFHSVNALYGRDYGNRILRIIGSELKDFLNEQGGIGCRIEADCFAVYCSKLSDPRALLSRLQGKLDRLSANIGIMLRMGVMPWQENTKPQQLVEQALIACNRTRGQHNDRLIVFDDVLRERENYEQHLISGLHDAISRREFVVHYQPKFDITVDPPVLKSAEALVRWKHPELGTVPPGDFIPLFEKNGQIVLIDSYVWEEVARQIALWRDKYGVTIPVSVNLSRIDVLEPKLVSTIDSIVRKYGLETASLQLEVTETAYSENTFQFISVMESLRKRGYEIEMDDFGSGYSSLNQLTSLPIDVIKMDRTFIRDIENSEKDAQVVKLILEIAKNLGLPVIAEGVETPGQLQMLKDYGCAMVQGFLLSEPLPPEEFETEFIVKH